MVWFYFLQGIVFTINIFHLLDWPKNVWNINEPFIPHLNLNFIFFIRKITTNRIKLIITLPFFTVTYHYTHST